MKYIITFFFLFIITSDGFSQVTGTTKTGSLLKKKVVVQPVEEKLPPKIVLLEPLLGTDTEIKSNDATIKIKGSIMGQAEIKEFTINGIKKVLIQGNGFSDEIKLKTGKNEIVIKALDANNLAAELHFTVIKEKDKSGPEITILEPAVSRGIKIIRKSEVTKVRGKAVDPNGVVKVTINQQEAELSDDGEFSLDMYLKVGDNKIVVEALDGNLNSSMETFYITRKLEDLITAGKYIGLVIGIDSYEGYWPELENAVNDAEGIAEVLKENYHFDTVYTILDKEATRRNIIQKFEWLTRNVTKDDNLLIFYAGHGQFNKALNKGYWVPVDANENSIADYISNNDVKTFIGGIPSKHTLLITDACFSGDIFRGPRTESIQFDPNNMERYYKEVYRKLSRVALTSGGLEEVADEGKDDHSVFTYYLIKALKENKLKYMDANQLFNEFRIAVTNNSEQTPMLQVIRDTDDEGGQFVFIKKD
ncbi:MAG TPA: caspase family protein [Ignavibacteriaceae bacterium]|nr:caspase family protein [Ignavibacteriaceae bacterium]